MTDPLERIAIATESIARDLHELLELGRPHVDVLSAYQRGGKLAAWTASRRARSSADHAADTAAAVTAGYLAAGPEEDGDGRG